MQTKEKDQPAAPSAPRQQPVDFIQKITGAFGKYQLLLCGLVFLSKFPVAFHQMAIIFLGHKVSFTCEGESGSPCPCPNPIYDTSIFSDNIIMHWNLICSRKWLVSLNQTLFQLGTLIGSILFGMASDRFGRRHPFNIAVVMQGITGVGAAFATDYWVFTALRFLVGMSVGGIMVISFVIIMEFIGSQYRYILSALFHVPFNLGNLLLPVIGYFFRDYKHFQLAISVPSLVLFSYICLIPETPRWLIAMKRTEEAVQILEQVAKINQLPTANVRPDVEAYHASVEKNTLKKGSLLDLFRTPNLRKHILCMSFNWLTCSYCFYGGTQYVGELSGNVFLNVAASACTTLLATLLSIPLLRTVGRRTIMITFNFICAFSLFSLIFLPAGVFSVIFAISGVVTSFVVFVVVYLYCSELFPTVVRNVALGFSSMTARIGSMMAPFVVENCADIAHWLPPLLLCIIPFVAGFTGFLLPETKDCELTTTLEEGERFGEKNKNRTKK